MALVLITVAPVRAQTGTNQTLTNPTPSDARMNQFEDAKGTSWRVFAVDSYSDGPAAIVQVEEVRQQNPPSVWGVYVQSRALMPVASVTLAAAVVDVNGTVKAVQTLPAIKNLNPSQLQRRQTRITVTTIAPTDRVVFFVKEVSGETGAWKAVDAEVAALIREGARRLPVP